MTVTVRNATSGDHDLIVHWNLALAAESESKALNPVVVEQGVQRVLQDPALGRYFIVEVGGQPAGQMMLTYEWSDWRNGMFWWIQSVYVDSDFRGRGIFRSLYEHVRGLAEQDGCVCGLRLYVHNENTDAIEVYRRLGMVDGHYRVMETEF